MRKTTLLLLIVFCTAVNAQGQQRDKPGPPRPPDPFHRGVRIRERYKSKGYPNVLTANLPQLIAINNVVGIAGGLEYERFVNAHGFFSINMPFYAAIGNDHPFTQLREGVTYNDGRTVYFAPGFRIHPMGNKRKADLAFGFQYAIGSLNEDRLVYKGLGHEYNGTDHYTVSMILFQASVNFHTHSHFVFGVQMSAGPSLSPDLPHSGMFQLGFKLGSRF